MAFWAGPEYAFVVGEWGVGDDNNDADDGGVGGVE
jgi:hypothetical protein